MCWPILPPSPTLAICFPRASSFLQPPYLPAYHFHHPEEKLCNTCMLYYEFIYIYLYIILWVSLRGCPKTLTQGPLPRHYILANALCLSSLFTVLKIHIVWSMVLGAESCFGVNASYTSEQLSWQRNLSTLGDRLTSKLCIYKIHGCYWLRLLGSKKSNPTSVQFPYVVLTLPLPTPPPAELALSSDNSFFAQLSLCQANTKDAFPSEKLF